MIKIQPFSLLLALTSFSGVFAQSVSISGTPGLAAVLPAKTSCSGQSYLACAIPNLYGQYGLALPNPSHTAHFNSTFQSNFAALNTAIATQLTLLPLASPASGFTYTYDANSGVYTRSADSFGPVLTERAETIGRHKLFFGGTFQRFRFDKIDGVPLHNLPAVFTHQEGTGPGGAAEGYENQFVSTQNSIDLRVNQFTVFGTFGVTDRIDISVAVPLLQVGYNVNSVATINRLVNTEPLITVNPNGTRTFGCCSSGPPYAHYFDPANQAGSVVREFSNNRADLGDTDNLYWNPSNNSAAGIGDVTFRFKGTAINSDRTSLAILTDLRVPTGDEKNFLGSGAYGIKPFVALSVRTPVLTPHVNLGYQWNGESLMAGDVITGTKARLPGYVFYSVGADVGLSRHLTFAADYIGQELINAPRVTQTTYTSVGPLTTTGQIGTFPTISSIPKDTYNQSNAAFGFKVNIFNRLLLSGNLLVALNDGGLRQRLTPLIGASYTF